MLNSFVCTKLGDINECRASPPKCEAPTICENNHGSFACVCAAGYQGETCDGKLAELFTESGLEGYTLPRFFIHCEIPGYVSEAE